MVLRNARLITSAKLRQWELDSEQAPPDNVHFWKLTEDGGVHAVTVPDALFASNERLHQVEGDFGQDGQQGDDDVESRAVQQPLRLISSQSRGIKERENTPSVQPSLSTGKKQQQQQQQRNKYRASTGKNGPDGDINLSVQKRSGADGDISASGSATVDRRVDEATDEQPLAADNSKNTGLQGTNPAPREVDRFGRKIKTTTNDADRGNVKRLKGLPEGTLIALGWGWGGEFRIGTGRDGSESSPRPLHPNFRVR